MKFGLYMLTINHGHINRINVILKGKVVVARARNSGIFMIKNGRVLRVFEDSFARSEGRIPQEKAFKIFSAMWQEAIHLGKIPFSDPLEGIEVDIKVARIINSCLKKSSVP
jgi:hypothetical protein